MTRPSPCKQAVAQPGREPRCSGSQPCADSALCLPPCGPLHPVVLGMQGVGNKAPCLCPQRCAPSSSQLPQIMQEPWGDACTDLLTPGPSVPYAAKDGARNMAGVR